MSSRRYIFTLRALSASIVFAAGCSGGIELPQSFEGTYVTADEPYADRAFTLTAESFVVHLDEQRRIKYTIHEVLHESRPSSAVKDLYTVVYLNNAGLEYKLRFHSEGLLGESLVFENQPAIRWTKQEGRP